MPRLVFVSDTHTMHAQTTQHIVAASADILVHAGDFSSTGKRSEIADFADWCSMLLKKGYVKHVVVVAGNHDILLDSTCAPYSRRDDPDGQRQCIERIRAAGVVYLCDSGATVAGLRFYGIPWTPRFFDWAFQVDSPGQDEDVFGKVPADLDVLVTHGPPYGIGDLVPRGERTGSRAHLRTIERLKPRVNVFGHIHEGYGMTVTPWGTLCINASTCTGDYKPHNRPIVLDMSTESE